ncbi:MAG: HIT family protein [Anaerolineae bacterium]|nr:HIT family protein [Anaerolineae bacterium]
MYNHAPANYICPFCLLIQRQENEHLLSVPDDIIYHDTQITVFIGSHQWPNNHGNVIIVPNEHFENIYDLPIHYAAAIHQLAQRVALAMKAIYACDGVSTRQHNEPGGNQDVWHYHLHVTPRYQNDGFYGSPRQFMPPSQRAVHAEKLRNYLTK